mgnify:CR=1 FL=1
MEGLTTPLLDDEDLENINRALEMAQANDENIIRAEQAEIDVTAAKERSAEVQRKLRLIKTAFFPNR